MQREYADTSDDSEGDIGERPKRPKLSDMPKYSPIKRTSQRGDGDKKYKRIDEEDKANDADEEDQGEEIDYAMNSTGDVVADHVKGRMSG